MNELVALVGAQGLVDLGVLLVNGLVAAVICVVLVFAHPEADQTFALHGRLARYVLAAVYGIIAVRSSLGCYHGPVEPVEVAVNVIVLWQVWLVGGDMSLLVRAIHSLQSRRQDRR